jgi:predicted SAM-dependent methyltransferase
VVRIAMPSLDFILERAVSSDWRAQDWLTWPAYQQISTRAEMLNVAFRDWGHRYLYDREELHRRLAEAGFTTVVDVEHGQSELAELRGRESRPDSRLICEAKR